MPMYIAHEEPLGNIFKKLVTNTIKFTQAVDPVSKVLSKTNIAKSTAGAILVPTAINVSKPKPAPVQQTAPEPVQQALVQTAPAPAPEESRSLFDPTTKKILIWGGAGVAAVTLAYLVFRPKKKATAVNGLASPGKSTKPRQKAKRKK